MKYLALFICLHLLINLHAQQVVHGIVKDGENGEAIAGVSIFVSNTWIGTTSSANGSYMLNIPQGKYEVVFSAIGYQTRAISSDMTDSFINVKLFPKVMELDPVTVRAYDRNGWEHWGQFFLDNFIGLTPFSAECKLENSSVMRFYYDIATGQMTAIAKDMLIVTNKALGYRIKYQLENFTYDSRSKIVHFEGYPYFEEMKGSERKLRQWQHNRKEAYEGSIMHFMRAVYTNRIMEEGFEVHRLKKIRNTEKDSIRQLIRAGKAVDRKLYEKMTGKPDQYDVMSTVKLTGDSIAYAVDSVTAGCSFNDYLDVTYAGKKVLPEYLLHHTKAPKERISQITLTEAKEIMISANGNYFPTNTMLTRGYWSWSENIGNLLPLGYKPDK